MFLQWVRFGKGFARKDQRLLVRFSSSSGELPSAESSISGALWYSNVFPVTKSFFYLKRLFLNSYASNLKLNASTSLLPSNVEGFKTISVYPNIKEGGVLLNYEYIGEKKSSELIEQVQTFLEDNRVVSFFNLKLIKVHEVKGTPFIEDMSGHLPQKTLKVEFEGPDVHSEKLYSEFRKYGRINAVHPAPQSSKERYTMVEYAFLSSASIAKNCLHGKMMYGTRLTIDYEKTEDKKKSYWKTISDNPRVAIPLLLALFLTISTAIFDPLRAFFVTNRLTHRYSIQHYMQILKDLWLSWTIENHPYLASLVKDVEEPEAEGSTWKEREEEELRLGKLVKETPSRLVVVYGPRGSGKSQLVEKALKNVKYKMTIDCTELENVASKYVMLSRLSKQIAFWPEMNFIVSFGGMIDGILTAMTGAKTSFATTPEVQVKKMFEALTQAATAVFLQERQARADWQSKNLIDSDESSFLVPPEIDYPVIVIEGFKTKDVPKDEQFFQDILTGFASESIKNKLVHVVFVSNEPDAVKALDKTSGNQPIELISLDDAPLASALTYVRDRLGLVFTSDVLAPCVAGLGGRTTDLKLLIQKIKAGATPVEAFNGIVIKSISEIKRIEKSADGFNVAQFWSLIKLLSKTDEIGLEELRFNTIFNGEDVPFQSLENSGLIGISHTHGGSTAITPGKPVYRIAFQQMVKDKYFAASMGIKSNKFLIKQLEDKILKYEGELKVLGEISKESKSFMNRNSRQGLELRINYLGDLLIKNSKLLIELEGEISNYKKSLIMKETK